MRVESAFHIDVEKCCLVVYGTTTPGVLRIAKLLVMNMGLHCIAVYRFGRFAMNVAAGHKMVGKPIRFAYLLLKYLILLIHKVELQESCEIGPGFHISHVGSIFIGARRIGENCTVTHNVTLGQGFEATGNRLPTIGNHVWIGTGSVIAGDVTIGDGATISAGSIVTRSVSPRCLIAGNPARVIEREYDNTRMILYEMANSDGGPSAKTPELVTAGEASPQGGGE